MSRVVPAPEPTKAPQDERFVVHDGKAAWPTEARTHRQAALKYAEKNFSDPEALRDELVLVVIRERDGRRCAALLKSKIVVQWTAPQVEEVSL